MPNSNKRKQLHQDRLSYLTKNGFSFIHTDDDTIKVLKSQSWKSSKLVWGEYNSIEQAVKVIMEVVK